MIANLLARNADWSARMRRDHIEWFDDLAARQAPEYFWIGCSDSGVPANAMAGLEPGAVFVRRKCGERGAREGGETMSLEMRGPAAKAVIRRDREPKFRVVGNPKRAAGFFHRSAGFSHRAVGFSHRAVGISRACVGKAPQVVGNAPRGTENG